MGTHLPSPKMGRPPFSAHIYCGQTAEWINMALGTEVGLGPGHIVPDGDPTLLPKKGTEPPILGPFLLWPNGCMYQDTTWYGGRPQPRRHCVRWDPASPHIKGHSPQFSANVCCGQTAGWTKMPLAMEVGLGPGDFVFGGDLAAREKKAQSFHPIFGPCLVAKRPDGSRCHLVRK